MKRPEMLNQQKSSIWNTVFVIMFGLLIIAVLFNLWFIQTFIVVEVSGSSMEKTVFDGDILYAERDLSPRRGDVVIIDVSTYDGKGFRGSFIIKRLIAVEGDTVKCEDGVVYLLKAGNEEFTAIDDSFIEFPTDDFRAVTVGEGEIFFLGDHRNNSTDSRIVGCLNRTDIVGVVPEWAIKNRKLIGKWEAFRSGLLGGRTKTEE